MIETQEVIKVRIEVPAPHSKSQEDFVRCNALREICKAGRRWGKTVGVSIIGSEAFLGVCGVCGGDGCSFCDNTGRVKPKRVLYAAPTAEQVGKFWFEVTGILAPGVDIGYFKKDETEHFIEVPGTEQRIKAKTAWNASTMRGDWGDLVILEEYQLWNEDAWQDVVQPMLIDTNGRAIFIFTPPSLKSEGVSKAKDPRHATKLYKRALLDTTGRWKTFHFTSYDNPTLSQVALKDLTESGDMSQDTLRREIMAEDDEIESSWLVYGKFDESLCKIKRFDIPLNWQVFSGHDFGSANPAALFVAQVKLPLPPNAPSYLRYGDYVAFSEYAPGAGFSTAQHADRFKEIAKGYQIELSVGGNVTTEEEIRQGYRSQGWMIRAPEITKVNAQIDRVIGLFEQKQIFIFEDLYRLLSQIAECMWIVDEDKRTTNKIKDEAKYHLLAALRYLCPSLNIHTSYSGEIQESRWD